MRKINKFKQPFLSKHESNKSKLDYALQNVKKKKSGNNLI